MTSRDDALEPLADEMLKLAQIIDRDVAEDGCTINLQRRANLPRWTHHEYDLARALITALRPAPPSSERAVAEKCAEIARPYDALCERMIRAYAATLKEGK